MGLPRTIPFFQLCCYTLIFMLSACNLTRWVPDDRQLLMENKVEVQGSIDNQSPLRSIIKQKPNRRIAGIGPRIYLHIYNWGDPSAEKGLNKLWTDIGEPPVIMDSVLVAKSAKQMGIYLFNKGYFENQTSFEILKKSGKKKAEVHYTLYPGPRYFIDSLSIGVRTPSVEAEIQRIAHEQLIQVGDPYDAEMLDKERDRIVDHLRNRGYFAFPKERIHFEADTHTIRKTVSIHMRIDDRVYETRDSVYTEPYHPWHISRVTFDDQYSLEVDRIPFTDSVVFDHYDFLYREGERQMEERVPIDATHFAVGDLYQQDKVKDSYRHLVGLKVFQSIDIAFKPDPNDSSGEGLVARLRLNPMPRNTFTTELKGTNTAGNFGIGGSLGWTKRNLSGRGEIFNIRLRGSIEAQYNSRYSQEFFNTRELGAEVSVEFPRFLLPFNSYGLLPKRMRPSSAIAYEAIWQDRAEFTRVLFNTRLSYNWWESVTKQHILTFLDWRYTNVLRIEDDFFNDLQFKNGFESVVALGTKYTFRFNEQAVRPKGNFRAFTSNLETAGNVFGKLFDQANPEGNDAATIFGVRATQYMRLDADFTYYWRLPAGQSLVSRMYLGLLYAYGNGQYVLPFEKSFFGGGTNDNRAWPAYRLGPGGFRAGAGSVNIAPFKIMGNVEYRFPILGALKSALFVDFGNIWIIQSDLPVYEAYREIPEAVFNWNTFYDQIAIGVGTGLRYDVGFFVIRLDAGWPMRYPYDPEGDRGQWFPRPLGWDELTYNVGIGYPF